METTITLQVRLFAILREYAGQDQLALTVPVGTNVGQLLDHVRDQVPALGPYLPSTRVAVNLTFAFADQVIQANDDLALIPPVGGG